MPDLIQAHLRHTIHYLRKLEAANDQYLAGYRESMSALADFDHNQTNIYAAQKWLGEYSSAISQEQILSDEISRNIVDLCNAFPDAGAYLISFRLGPHERIRWLQVALNASKRLENPVTTQAHLGNLGLAYSELGKLSLATDYFKQAMKLAEQIDDRYHQGAWLGNLGNVYARLGEHQKAIEYHQQHLGIAKDIKDARGEGHALANLGVSFAFLGKSEKALQYYKQCLNLAVQRGDHWDQSQALLNIGLAYFDIGDFEASKNNLEAALEICIGLNDPLTQALVMGGLADIRIEQNAYDAAVETLKQALQILKSNHPDIGAELRLLQSLGNAYNANNDYPQALNIYSQLYKLAESIGAKASMCSALSNQTSIYRAMGNLDHALDLGVRCLQLSKEVKSMSSEAFIRWQLGLIYQTLGEKKKAIQEMEAAIQIETQISSIDLMTHKNYLEEYKIC
jgi:tetratricopeptide (TPR) repeat protein